MPRQFWKHQCPGGSPFQKASPRACACGEPVVYAGWKNTAPEAMAWSQKFSGLRLVGPHRALQDRLFAGTHRQCDNCAGGGYFDAVGGLSFELCGVCDGAGYVSTISPEQRAELRSEVLAVFPSAGAPMDLPNPAFTGLVHDLGEHIIFAVPTQLNG